MLSGLFIVAHRHTAFGHNAAAQTHGVETKVIVEAAVLAVLVHEASALFKDERLPEPIVRPYFDIERNAVRITQLFNGTAQTNDFFPFSREIVRIAAGSLHEIGVIEEHRRGCGKWECVEPTVHRTDVDHALIIIFLRPRIAFRFKEVGDITDGVAFF